MFSVDSVGEANLIKHTANKYVDKMCSEVVWNSVLCGIDQETILNLHQFVSNLLIEKLNITFLYVRVH